MLTLILTLIPHGGNLLAAQNITTLLTTTDHLNHLNQEREDDSIVAFPLEVLRSYSKPADGG